MESRHVVANTSSLTGERAEGERQDPDRTQNTSEYQQPHTHAPTTLSQTRVTDLTTLDSTGQIK